MSGELGHVIEDATKAFVDSLLVLTAARGGNYMAAAEASIQVVQDVAQTVTDAAPMVSELVADTAIVSHAISHVLSSGIVHALEAEFGAITDAARSRLKAFVHGVVHSLHTLQAPT